MNRHQAKGNFSAEDKKDPLVRLTGRLFCESRDSIATNRTRVISVVDSIDTSPLVCDNDLDTYLGHCVCDLDCELLDRPVIGGNISGGGNVAGGDAWPTSSGLDDGCYERQLPKRNSSGDVERATNCRPSGVPRWPGVDTLIVACQRYVQGN